MNDLLRNLFKYLLEGMAVAVAAFFIPRRTVELREIVLIALTAAAVFSILDQITPEIGLSARRGAGFGIGFQQVGWGNLNGGQANNSNQWANCTCDIDLNYLKEKLENNGESLSNVSSDSTRVPFQFTPSFQDPLAAPKQRSLRQVATLPALPNQSPLVQQPVVQPSPSLEEQWGINPRNILTPNGVVAPPDTSVITPNGRVIEGFDPFNKKRF